MQHFNALFSHKISVVGESSVHRSRDFFPHGIQQTFDLLLEIQIARGCNGPSSARSLTALAALNAHLIFGRFLVSAEGFFLKGATIISCLLHSACERCWITKNGNSLQRPKMSATKAINLKNLPLSIWAKNAKKVQCKARLVMWSESTKSNYDNWKCANCNGWCLLYKIMKKIVK